MTSAQKKAAKFKREFGSKERVELVNAMPSVTGLGWVGCVNAHVGGGGMGYRGDARFIVPLTDREHKELHQHGIKTFEAKYHVDLAAAAVATNAACIAILGET